jgi:hypothetical protein
MGTAIGETRTDVGWRITFGGKSLLLEEDMSNWPTDHITYEATLTGTQFTATYSQGADYLNWVCQFRGGTLAGSFSVDFSTFEAVENANVGASGGRHDRDADMARQAPLIVSDSDANCSPRTWPCSVLADSYEACRCVKATVVGSTADAFPRLD